MQHFTVAMGLIVLQLATTYSARRSPEFRRHQSALLWCAVLIENKCKLKEKSHDRESSKASISY